MQIFDHNDRKRHKFWNTAPTDGRARANKAGVGYFPRGRALMPPSPMPIGEHAGKTMRQVPLDYLAWVNTQPWSQQWSDWQPIADYLERFPLPEKSLEAATETRLVFVEPLCPSVVCADWRFPQMSRLTGSPGAETCLHAFAVGALALSRSWFRERQRGEPCGHYQLSPSVFALACERGAVILTTQRERDDHNAAHFAHLRDRPCTLQGYTEDEAAAAIAKNNHGFRRHKGSRDLTMFTCDLCGFVHLAYA